MLTDPHIQKLKSINSLEALLDFLRDDLNWQIADGDAEDVTFQYEAHELGLKEEHAPKVNKIYQIRPMTKGQPWGIFFIDFDNRKIPVTIMRKILHGLVKKKRGGNATTGWNAGDLLFMTTYGEEVEAMREVAFAHFHEQTGDIPTLNVLQWDANDTSAKLQTTYQTLKSNLGWPPNTDDREAWRKQWSKPFRHGIGHSIKTSKALAEELASLSRKIRQSVNEVLQAETEKGQMTKLYKAFKEALLHDLQPDQFADTFSQTISYGLLTAAFSRTPEAASGMGTHLLAEDAPALVPVTNPFLQEVLETFLFVGGRNKAGIDFDYLGVQDVVELLRSPTTDLNAIRNDFGNRKPGEDPVIHFYEDYLAAYDKPEKKKRGVFYTPQPVVSYIVRSVHELLQTEFGLEDGLASTITWAEMAAKNPAMKIPEVRDGNGHKVDISDQHFVTILDPATGTATFLVEVIEVIHRTMAARWKAQGKRESEIIELWNSHVPDHLLPRLYGYELMMAPYAIAHMKIGLKLWETGYKFETDKRVRIYLTNALEPPSELQARLALDWEALAHEAQGVKAVKETERFTVIVGNPPYSGVSSNMSAPAQQLVDAYRKVDGKPLNERKLWLQDDYVKFFRKCQISIDESSVGILGIITNHGYIDNPTFRGMRQSVIGTFQDIYVLDLHGNTNKREESPNGSEDKNVFDIRQGVSIFLGVHGGSLKGVRHADLWGERDAKYRSLLGAAVCSTPFSDFVPDSPFYFLEPQLSSLRGEYESWPRVSEAMPLYGLGFQSSRDHLVVGFSPSEVESRIAAFVDPARTDDEVRREYFPGKVVNDYPAGDTRQWRLPEARSNLRRTQDWQALLRSCLYRPFDCRTILWDQNMVDWPRPEVLGHMLYPNLALITNRQSKEDFAAFCTTLICERKIAAVYDASSTFPLYLYQDKTSLAFGGNREANFCPSFLDKISVSIRRSFSIDSSSGEQDFSAEDLFHYIYAVFYSSIYRSRYAEFLRVDFPRIPLPGSEELFDALVSLGAELVGLHLMQSSHLEDDGATFIGPTNPQVEKVSFSNSTVWLDKQQAVGFEGVSEEVWNFHIGGYQVCEKWLKDRGPKKGNPGRILTPEDIDHYQRIIVALSETICIVKQIDIAIDQHGGWPGAFQSGQQTE